MGVNTLIQTIYLFIQRIVAINQPVHRLIIFSFTTPYMSKESFQIIQITVQGYYIHRTVLIILENIPQLSVGNFAPPLFFFSGVIVVFVKTVCLFDQVGYKSI